MLMYADNRIISKFCIIYRNSNIEMRNEWNERELPSRTERSILRILRESNVQLLQETQICEEEEDANTNS